MKKKFNELTGQPIWNANRLEIECPFCNAVSKVPAWSLKGTGKMCPCGAKHLKTGFTQK